MASLSNLLKVIKLITSSSLFERFVYISTPLVLLIFTPFVTDANDHIYRYLIELLTFNANFIWILFFLFLFEKQYITLERKTMTWSKHTREMKLKKWSWLAHAGLIHFKLFLIKIKERQQRNTKVIKTSSLEASKEFHKKKFHAWL